MITAAEARKLTNESEANILKWLDYFDKKIRQVASNNKTKYECIESEFVAYPHSNYEVPSPNALQLSIMIKLQELGFNVAWKCEKYKAGGGLGDLDDTPMENRPDHHKYFISIGW